MSEQGTAFSTDDRGGLIATSLAPSPVSYDGSAIKGTPPSEHETVVFDRASGSNVATSVRVASASLSDLTSDLRGRFEDVMGSDRLTDGTRAEVVRLAADRALRIERPLVPGEDLPEKVRQARIALAVAAMALMAAESEALASDEITVSDLRRILRRQRPALPR